MKSRIKYIVWPIIYLVLIISVCISFVMVFRSYYFRSIFVSGSSMSPTLNGVGNEVDFGLIDDHKNAINKVKRFQIITTYYPFSDSKDYVGGYDKEKENVIDEKEASYKIKRVYGLPGDSIKFVINREEAQAALDAEGHYSEQQQYHAQRAIEFYVKTPKDDDYVKQEIKFKRKINVLKFDQYDNFTYDLGDDEYWVMGDNYSASSDCFTKKLPIYYDNIVGVLISIEGTCKIESSISPDSTVDDGTKVSFKCTHRKHHFPVFY